MLLAYIIHQNIQSHGAENERAFRSIRTQHRILYRLCTEQFKPLHFTDIHKSKKNTKK